ncbi:E3 ubiquitin-protein ligase PUB22 [Bienertia sinuspersici]
MKDPVTVCTGITYDRESIEKWVFSSNNTCCPVTKQVLVNNEISNTDILLTPNHTLRRLIQSWCTLNACYGVERFPTPKAPVTKAQIQKLIGEGPSSSPYRLMKCLETIKSIGTQSGANKRCLETTPGVAQFLARVIVIGEDENDERRVSEEALSILAHLNMSDEMVLKKMLNENNEGNKLVDALVKIMQRSNYNSRAYAVGLLKQLIQVGDPIHVVALKREHFVEIVTLIKDDVTPKATRAALRVLALACPWGRNRIRVVESGAIPVLVGLLVEWNDKRTTEIMLTVLDHLSGCAEGRAAILGHAAGLAVVSKKILRVSNFATEKGVKILFSISRFSGALVLCKR